MIRSVIYKKYHAYINIEPRCLGNDAYPGIRQAGLFGSAKQI